MITKLGFILSLQQTLQGMKGRNRKVNVEKTGISSAIKKPLPCEPDSGFLQTNQCFNLSWADSLQISVLLHR